jgi:hypothetical protein
MQHSKRTQPIHQGHLRYVSFLYILLFLLFKSCKEQPLHVCTDYIDSNCMICNLNNYVMVDVIFLVAALWQHDDSPFLALKANRPTT